MQIIFGTTRPNAFAAIVDERDAEIQKLKKELAKLKASKSFFRPLPLLRFLFYKTTDTNGSIPGNEA